MVTQRDIECAERIFDDCANNDAYDNWTLNTSKAAELIAAHVEQETKRLVKAIYKTLDTLSIQCSSLHLMDTYILSACLGLKNALYAHQNVLNKTDTKPNNTVISEKQGG